MVSPDRIRVVCPACQAAFDAARAGQTVTCPHCLEEFEARPAASPAAREAAGEGGKTSRGGQRSGQSVGSSPRPAVRPGQARGNPSSPPPPADEADADYEFDVECPLCGTRQDAVRQQIGGKLRCPDCDFQITVREPPPRARRVPGQRIAEDDEIRLSELPGSNPLHTLARDYLRNAEAQTPREKIVRRNTVSPVPDALARARLELEAEEAALPPLPRRPLTTRLLRFLREPAAFVRGIILGLALQIELAAVDQALVLYVGGPFEQFLCAMLLAFSIVFGVALFAVASVTLLAVLEDTAAGKDVIESWPEGYFVDWFLDAFYVVAALFVAALPGVLLGQLLQYGAPAADLIRAQGLGGALSAFVLFPFLLLSALETGSPLNIASRPVARSLRLLPGGWLRFYVASGLLWVAAWGALWLAVTRPAVVATLATMGVAFLLMLYFRLMGRLAWACREAVAEAEAKEEAAAAAAEAAAEAETEGTSEAS